MPPMGQFDPPSTSKENKKRRHAGSTLTAPAPVLPTVESNIAQISRPGPVQVSNVNKVRIPTLAINDD